MCWTSKCTSQTSQASPCQINTATLAAAAALRLEIIGRHSTFVHIEEALADLEQEVARLHEALGTFTEEGAACAS